MFWERIRSYFSGSAGDLGDEPEASVEDVRLADLYVIPNDGEDFDAESCKRLLDGLANAGARTVGDVMRLGISVPLEQFFTGNRCKHSIAANVCPEPPYDTAQSWFNHLKSVRDHPQVQDVLVQVYMVEPYEDRSIRTWPYSDTVWVYSTLDQQSIASLLDPIDPDEVRDASASGFDRSLSPPKTVPKGSKPYWVWWD